MKRRQSDNTLKVGLNIYSILTGLSASDFVLGYFTAEDIFRRSCFQTQRKIPEVNFSEVHFYLN